MRGTQLSPPPSSITTEFFHRLVWATNIPASFQRRGEVHLLSHSVAMKIEIKNSSNTQKELVGGTRRKSQTPERTAKSTMDVSEAYSENVEYPKGGTV